ncbi:MAG: ABC transporter permease [bacterium]
MLKNYLKTALRNLVKNKMYSIINLIGLGVAVGCCVTAYVNYEFSQSYDDFHTNKESIYRINSYKMLNGRRQNWALAPRPLMEQIQGTVPGIERAARIAWTRAIMRYSDQVFRQGLAYADPDFLRMFSFPLLHGEKEVLEDQSAIVLTDETAEKYFGKENPIGKQVIITFEGQSPQTFVVQAIVEKPPLNSNIFFQAILPYERVANLLNIEPDNWERWNGANFILATDRQSLPGIEVKLRDYLQIANESNPDWQIAGFYLDPLKNISDGMRTLRGDPLNGGMPISAVVGPSITAFLVLILACFNFMNTSIAFSARRLKEIGVRKVLGSMRSQLQQQFFGENLLLCFFSLLVGIGLAEIFVPAYDSLWPYTDMKLSYAEDYGIFIFLACLLLFTGLLAGAYPAIYISKYNPTTIFRGKQRFGSANLFTRILLTFQFALCMLAIIMGVTMMQNAKFQTEYDHGFAIDRKVAVTLHEGKNYEIYKQAITGYPAIQNVGGSVHVIGQGTSIADVEIGDKKNSVRMLFIGENFFETMELALESGKIFDANITDDLESSVIVNETFLHEFDISEIEGLYLKIADKEYRVAGVVKDFLHSGLWRKVEPCILRLSKEDNYNYLTASFAGIPPGEITAYLAEKWKGIFPDLPFSSFFQDEILTEARQVNDSIKTTAIYISMISILIAAMGLFALVSLNIARRTKEIGIRKILGATTLHIGGLISRQFVMLISIAAVLSIGMGYMAMNSLLSAIWAYHVGMTAMPYVFAAVLVFTLAYLTVGSQVYKVAQTNPANALRYE